VKRSEDADLFLIWETVLQVNRPNQQYQSTEWIKLTVWPTMARRPDQLTRPKQPGRHTLWSI